MEILQKLLPMPPLASAEGLKIDILMYLIHGLVALLFFGWAIYFIVVLIKFRKKPNVQARDSHDVTKVSSVVEWAVIILEFVLLFAFSMPFWAVNVAALPPMKDVLEVKVIAQQFAWNVHYAGPDGHFGKVSAKLLNEHPIGLDLTDPDAADDITTMNQIYVPVNKTVLIRLTSKDVIHSFGVPAMRAKQDVIPGMSTMVWFTPTKTGQFEIVCSQLCGMAHYRMRGVLNVLSQQEYDQWIKEQKGIHD